MAIREGAWDCPACGRKGNRGPEKFCGGCGRPRGPDVKFYLPDEAPEVTDAEALKRSQAGADWICPYCNADNPAANAFCSGCGAPRDGARTRAVVDHPLNEKPATPGPQPLAVPVRGGGSFWKKGFGLGCLGLLGLVVLLIFLGRPKSTTLTVTGHHWARTIAVEVQKPVAEQAWEGEVPSGARVLGSSREVHHVDRIQTGTRTRTRTVTERVQTGTQRVKTGTRDLGNGYFQDVYQDRPVYQDRSHQETYQEPVYREQPVYRQRIRYEIEKWVRDREARAEGGGLAPAWPDPGLAPKQRESGRQELYEVLFKDADGRPAHYRAPDEQAWRRLEEGRSYKGKVKSDGEVVEVGGDE
ncbi:MAG: zinc ribbon domain-containing protein [Acidobacteria bacterium]|nr:zinc ribbon domain-containing protein [Acidobacteriota bacterium]